MESAASKTSTGNLRAGQGKVELEHPGGILFAALSSELERTNSVGSQLCTNEVKADQAATCHALPSFAGADTGALLHLEKQPCFRRQFHDK